MSFIRRSIFLTISSFLFLGFGAAQRAQAQVESVLHSFTGGNDGGNPWAGLIRDSSGNLYGTTFVGGLLNNCPNGCGTVFELVYNPNSNSYTEQVPYSFAGGTDGLNPRADLVGDSTGNLYGTTAFGGSSNHGTAFELVYDSATGSYTEKVLYSFAGGSDGANPQVDLVRDSAGNLFGTTPNGGASGTGTVFELIYDPTSNSYTEQVLYSFTGGNDGAAPRSGLVRDSAGNLYGTTTSGGASNAGTVFELVYDSATGSYTEKSLYSFAGGNDGMNPYAGLIMDSSANFYGTTSSGGASNAGTVFELIYDPTSNSYTEHVLYSFTGGNDGSGPYAALVRDSSGNLYGTTQSGGSSLAGTVFELVYDSSSNSYTEKVLYTFTDGNDGGDPLAGLVMDPSGNLYGTTVLGGTSNAGTVYGIAPVTLSPTSLSFGNVTVGMTSPAQTVTVTNTGMGSLSFGAASISGANAADFAIDANTDTCSGKTVAPGSSCSVSVTFTPSATGSESASINLIEGGITLTVNLSGTGALPTVGLSGTSLTFSTQPVGATSAAQTVTITNTSTGAITLNVTAVSITSDFAIASNTCNTSVAAGGNCSVSITFTPTAAGARTGTLTFTDNAPDSPQTVALAGTGAVTTVSVSPATLSFGSQMVGTKSADQIVTVANTGGATNLVFSGIAVSSNFVIDASGTTCTTSAAVAPGGSCQVAVAFAPTTAGTLPGRLTFTDDASPSTQTVALGGTAPGVTLSPSSLTFSGTVVGSTSAAQSVTLTNSGTSSLTISSIAVNDEFAIAAAGTTCAAGTTLAASSSCTIAVTFTPSAGGTRTGAVTISDNAGSSPQTIALSGSGEDFSLTAGTTSQTVSPGGAATYNLQLSPEGGFNQAVSLACSGAPANSTCTVTPASATLDGTSNTAVTVKVTTTAASMLGPDGPANPAPPVGTLPIALWIAIFGLLGLMALARFSPKGGRVRQAAPWAALALLLALCAGCGGGSSGMTSGSNSSNATPAGTYTLTVTATSGSLTRTSQMTLNVQ